MTTHMSKLSFKTFCIENYAQHIGRPSNKVYDLFAHEKLLNLFGNLFEQEMSFSTASEVNAVPHDGAEFVSLICAEIRDARAVRRTVSLPKWLDEQAAVSGLSLSRVLQDALKERLNVN